MNEMDGLMMLFRAMNGEKNVIEHMEKEGQTEAVKNTMMAIKMNPKKEEWEKLGFVFTEIPGDDVLCNAQMPEGWSMKATDHSMWSEIIDNKGLKRGSMFYKASFYDRRAHMSLEPRYRVCVRYIDDNYTTKEIYFGNEKEKLFIAGQLYIPKDASNEEFKTKMEEEDKLKSIAFEFAKENYPDWKDVNAYWDIEENLPKKLENKKDE